jgi:hypothetical protein
MPFERLAAAAYPPARVPAEDWARLEDAFSRSRSGTLGERCEHGFIRRDGGIRRMRTSIHFRSRGGRACFRGISVDITAREDLAVARTSDRE